MTHYRVTRDDDNNIVSIKCSRCNTTKLPGEYNINDSMFIYGDYRCKKCQSERRGARYMKEYLENQNSFVYQSSSFDGLMLSDGSISMRGNSAIYQMTNNIKNNDWLLIIKEYFEAIGLAVTLKPTKNGFYGRLWTRGCQWLTSQYERWYEDGVKTVPSDIIFDDIMIANWVYGDGNVTKGVTRLHTEGFTHDEVEWLSNKINSYLDIDSHVVKVNSDFYSIIYIPAGYGYIIKQCCNSLYVPSFSYKINGFRDETPFFDMRRKWSEEEENILELMYIKEKRQITEIATTLNRKYQNTVMKIHNSGLYHLRLMENSKND